MAFASRAFYSSVFWGTLFYFSCALWSCWVSINAFAILTSPVFSPSHQQMHTGNLVRCFTSYGLDYTIGLLNVTLRAEDCCRNVFKDSLFENNLLVVGNMQKPEIYAALVDGRHRIAAIKMIVSSDGLYKLQSNKLGVTFSMFLRNAAISPHEVVFSSKLRNNLLRVCQMDRSFIQTMYKLLLFVKTFLMTSRSGSITQR